MKTSGTNRKLRVLIRAISDGTMVLRADFQRRLVWSNKHKNAFIRTVLEGLPFPEIYIAAGNVNSDTAEGTELIVDGQQRMSTLYQYFTCAETLKLELDITPYSLLPEEKKIEFLEYEVVIRDLGAIDIETIIMIFTRINSTNYALNALEVNNARYDGDFKRFCWELSEHEFFEKHKTFSPSEIKRMNDVKFILSIVISIMSSYFNRDSLFEEYLEKYDDSFPNKVEIYQSIDAVLNYIDSLNFPYDCRVYKMADLFTLIVELYKVKVVGRISIDSSLLREKLLLFYNFISQENFIEVEIDKELQIDSVFIKNVYEYQLAVLQAANDRGNRIIRGKIINDLVLSCIRIIEI